LDDGNVGTLRWAVGQANASGGPATITFAPAAFSTPQTIQLIGTLELSNTFATETITGPAAGVTVSGGGLSRVFQVDGFVNASISGLTITGGMAADVGGGLLNAGTTALTNCTISGNSARYGGGLYNGGPHPFGSVTLTDCTVSGNSANEGGGLFNGGAATLTGCTVSGNSAGQKGGGLANFGGTVALTNCTVSGDFAGNSGGGLYNFGSVTLTNCTVSGNNATINGGGLYNRFGTVALTNCTVSRNATRYGGGLLNAGTTALTNCTVSGNSASIEGGGLFNYGTATLSNCTVSGDSASFGGGMETYSGNTTLTNCTVNGNSATKNGGGLDNFGSGTTTLTNCTVSGNNARTGGGLSNFGPHTLALTDCTISGNAATSIGGGLFNYGTAALTDCTVSGNSARFIGGGLTSYGAATLTNCTVSRNATRYGGGLFSNGTLALASCTVSGNSASVNGGGVYVNHGTAALTNCTVSGNTAANRGGGLNFYAGSATLTNCTVSGNTAAHGGGLYAYNNRYSVFGPLSLTNTIVAGNTNTSSSASDISGSVGGTNNLIGTGGSGGLVNGVNGNIVGVANVLLAPLGNYGGPTQTMPLLPGSPAIDAGTSTGAPASDQRGQGRVGTVDIGAFESQGFSIAVTSGSGQATDVATAFPAPLVVKVTANNPMEPVAGGQVTFTPPSSGASATIGGSPALISVTGTASVTATGNGFAGSYTVSATARGITTPASLSLSNRPTITVPTATTAYQNVDQPISGISIGDAASATLTVTLNVSHGTLTLGTTTGLTTVTGNGSGAVTLTGTAAALNAALGSLVYRAGRNYSGGDVLSLTATDSGVNATPASVALTVESIAQQAADLQDRVSALQAAGVLNKGQANSLSVKLNLQGNDGDVGKVQAFLNEVAADVQAGILTQAEAAPLLYWGNILLLGVTRR
jgi:parallel beta-helix repeat protein